MRPRTSLTLVGGILLVAVLASAQTPPRQANVTATPPAGAQIMMTAARVSTTGSETTLTGRVVIQVNGVTLLADKAVVKDGEYQLEGNVRVKAPTPQTP